MISMEKIYHIYAKNHCLYHSLKEDEFQKVWAEMNRMVGLMHTDYKQEDLSYEELLCNRSVITEASY
jgi:hypothetical protein